MDKETKIIISVAFLTFITLFFIVSYIVATLPPSSPVPQGSLSNDEYLINEQNTTVTTIYAIQCPFGEYFANTQGSFSYFSGFGGGGGSGSISTSLSEDYVCKYMDGNELKTVIMPIDQSTVLVNGNYSIIIVHKQYGYIVNSTTPQAWAKYNDYDQPQYYPYIGKWAIEDGNNYGGFPTVHYVIDLPYLPKVAENMTSTWGGQP